MKAAEAEETADGDVGIQRAARYGNEAMGTAV